ncbi:acyl-CoA-binding protein [Ceraceosorus guamensis]|uniref:Acyl-CoA-binding protein n=1 Tax=Ceraceosorus guamensis TaxID=1522189 RepID=A0A316VUZ5_9BASI|nr:acyl-CoA-binding protein [Ceraceosorus guamensis]PWN41252.1 acyl-CoA-binding protein [Ceraceosorus guamensis]
MSSAQFDKAVSIIGSMPKDGPVQPTQSDQLTFYGLFKQASNGDVNTSRPGMMDFTGKAKWDAWKSREGLSADEAKKEYVDHLLSLLDKHSDNEDAKKWADEIRAA